MIRNADRTGSQTCRWLLPLVWLLMSLLPQARPLVIVAENYIPTSFVQNGEPAGLDVDVAKAVFGHLGVPCEFRIVPWARAWDMLKSGEADVGMHVSQNDERAAYVHWPANWVWMADFVFMTNRKTLSAYSLHSYDDVKRSGLSIGIINENSYYPGFWSAFPAPPGQHYNKQLEPAVDAAANLRKLAANHIQLFPIPLLVGEHMAKEMHLDDVTHYDWVIFSKPYPNAFSDRSTYSDAKYSNIGALMRAYDAELGRMKADAAEYHKFIQRYE